MTGTPFKPTVFLKAGCPFCLKVRLFLLESGQLDQALIREFVPGTEEETAIRELLGPVVENVTFPTAELTSGAFTTESDAIVSHFAERAGVKASAFPTYQSYLSGVLKSLQSLYLESVELKKRPYAA
jgi:glutathione S-transferase